MVNDIEAMIQTDFPLSGEFEVDLTRLQNLLESRNSAIGALASVSVAMNICDKIC